MISYGNHTHPPAKPIICHESVDVSFGNFCSIASTLTIVSGQHPPVEHPECVSQYPFREEFGWEYLASKMDGKVVVGNDVWIGSNVAILEGVTIGDGAIIGAYTIVTKDIPSYAVVVGNPGKVKKYRFEFKQIGALLGIAWWNWSDEKIAEAMPYMKNIEAFLDEFAS